MMKSKHTHQNKFIKIITMPIKALAKARDFYVKSMNNYAAKVSYNGSGWAGSNYTDAFPRSFSMSTTRNNETDDFKELVRAASTSTLGNRVDLGSVISSSSTRRNGNTSTINNLALPDLPQQKGNMGSAFNKGVSRSVSVGMAKIEEDKPVEFGETGHFGESVTNVKKKFGVFPRSKSHGFGGSKKSVGGS
ncbi:hypothetical protein RND81_14G087600 [Saponaria officinalis]|uniref:Uncharacterized protein n=1 Tax=Saponaria officinalis TaxID=3572 RepID=A0AAW1GNG2_SAPOF